MHRLVCSTTRLLEACTELANWGGELREVDCAAAEGRAVAKERAVSAGPGKPAMAVAAAGTAKARARAALEPVAAGTVLAEVATVARAVGSRPWAGRGQL